MNMEPWRLWRCNTTTEVCPRARRQPRRPPGARPLTVPVFRANLAAAGYPFTLFGEATVMYLKCPGWRLADLGIDACVYYSIAATVEEGVLTEEMLKETEANLQEMDAGLAARLKWSTGMVGVFLVFDAELPSE